MMILLDNSPAKIEEYSKRYGYDFGQLRTPLTNYARAKGRKYGVDNGCFSEFDEAAWLRLVAKAFADEDDPPMFVTLPDIVGDAARTIELFHEFKAKVPQRRALVLQDGISSVRIPWSELDAVFIGGSDEFKYSREAIAAAKTAKMLRKIVHLGRVNTAARVRNWLGLADTGDGSGMCRFDHMLEDVLSVVRGDHPQHALIA
jgi:hypothetical protein